MQVPAEASKGKQIQPLVSEEDGSKKTILIYSPDLNFCFSLSMLFQNRYNVSTTTNLGMLETFLANYSADLVMIDDMGMKQLPKRSGEYLFEIVMRRYQVRSTLMTSNRPLEDWGKLIGDVPAATAILDRFLHNADVIAITGRSYRLKDRAGKFTVVPYHAIQRIEVG